MLIVQGNISKTYDALGRHEEAIRMKRDVYFGYLRMRGEEDKVTLQFAGNYANSLFFLQRFEEAKALLRRMMPVARRVYGDSHQFTLMMRKNYAAALSEDTCATLDDLREAVTTLEDVERTARRVLGGAHPDTAEFEDELRKARAVLAVREGVESIREGVETMTLRDALEVMGV